MPEVRSHSVALLFLRLTAAALLLCVHGLPKLLHWSAELTRIEDPFHLGAPITLGLAVFAEVACPLAIALGLFTRLACLPVLAVLLIAVGVVHPEWTLEQGQFAWLLIIIFTTLLIAGPGAFAVGQRWRPTARSQGAFP